uniref:Uncharacterized protein n=1 Tax=Accipiter nisus TaxID=211598 RepID=A0A8B9RSW4_9AVES
MGVSGSAPVAPRNKHLAHVSDPRSPSAGIFRTPIEVVSSPAGSPQPGAAEPVAGSRQAQDPRSPAPGVSHTPRRAVSSGDLDRLVRQLNEAFGAEAAAQEPGPASPGEEPVVEEPARRSSPPAAAAPGEEAERPPSPGAAPARPGRLAGPGFSSGKRGMLGCVWGGPTGEAPCAWGASRSVGRAGRHPPVRGPSPGSRPHGDLVRSPPPRFGCPPSPRTAWPWGSAAGRPGGPSLGTVLLSTRFLARS